MSDFAAEEFLGLLNPVGARGSQVVRFAAVLRQVVHFPHAGLLPFRCLPVISTQCDGAYPGAPL